MQHRDRPAAPSAISAVTGLHTANAMKNNQKVQISAHKVIDHADAHALQGR